MCATVTRREVVADAGPVRVQATVRAPRRRPPSLAMARRRTRCAVALLAESVAGRDPADTAVFAPRKLDSFPLELVPLPQEPPLVVLVQLEPRGGIGP